jgi:hypothetical protein
VGSGQSQQTYLTVVGSKWLTHQLQVFST